MKTAPVIRLAALAAVLFVSASVAGEDPRYNRFRWDDQAALSKDDVILCIMDAVSSGDLSMISVLKCIKTFQDPNDPIPDGLNNYIHFKVQNGDSISETGTIMNADLTWGKWQQDDKDVDSVNNIEFDTKKRAQFTAIGRDMSPSGAEGSFEIYENGKPIADVDFSVPFMGVNRLKIHALDSRYLCEDAGFNVGGSLTVEIVCHKLADKKK
ncbi:unnamed protein product [Chrysodeixis includens]|uniref:Uncharacterized protein n=1 Tax=Chrysodeixis includens TaxID=689277 RepID=A0A9P0BVN6_CHRIL|nr:unnamed protein product [Chrysodeixis includens]